MDLRVCVLASSLVCVAAAVLAQPLAIPRVDADIQVDGRLDEAAWSTALRVTLDYEVRPRENVPPNVETEVYFAHDDDALYIGFRCQDPDPGAVRAYLGDRDSLGNDDWVAVELDTYHDQRRAFTLIVNAAGVQTDGLSDAAGIKDYSWDTIFDSAGRRTADGYVVEMAVPFSSLRFQRTDGPQTWGINVLRGFVRNQRYQIWLAPYDRGNSCRVCQYTPFEGFAGVTPGRNIELTPTVTGTLTRERPDFPDGDFETVTDDVNLGLTGRWGVTPNLFLGATVNPDFSQVEADALQLDINQPFAIFYEERRPFFTDGSDFFRTGLNLVHTRVVRDPRWGAKLTGKEGDHAIGAFIAEDDLTNILIPGAQSSAATTLDERNLSGVVRYSWDAWNNSDLGVVLTGRDSDSYENTVYGLTSLIRLGDNDTVSAEVLGSSTEYDEATATTFHQPLERFSDTAWTVDYTHLTAHYTGELGVREVGPGFRADLGFMPQVGLRSYSTRSIYEWRNDDDRSWWSTMRLLNAIYYDQAVTDADFPAPTGVSRSRRATPLDPQRPRTSGLIDALERTAAGDDGRPTDSSLLVKGVATSFYYVGPRETGVFLGNITAREVYAGREFDLSQYDLSLSMVPTGSLDFELWSTLGDRIDYANVRRGDRVTLGLNLGLHLGTHLEVDLSHTHEELDSGGDWLYEADISDATVVYNFNARSFLRAVVQLIDYERNLDNYPGPVPADDRRLFTELLFSYKVNARTVLFAGYSDHSKTGPDPAGLEHGLERSDHTVFVKLGYALVL